MFKENIIILNVRIFVKLNTYITIEIRILVFIYLYIYSYIYRNCLIKQPGEEDPDEGVKDLTELALKKLDVDHDGKISFHDYEIAIKEEPLLLEAFGQCLPTEESCAAFLATLQS